MKAYKITVLVLDFEGYGLDSAMMEIRNVRGASCTPMASEEADIGEWTDDHPLNHQATADAEFSRLFPTEPA